MTFWSNKNVTKHQQNIKWNDIEKQNKVQIFSFELSLNSNLDHFYRKQQVSKEICKPVRVKQGISNTIQSKGHI